MLTGHNGFWVHIQMAALWHVTSPATYSDSSKISPAKNYPQSNSSSRDLSVIFSSTSYFWLLVCGHMKKYGCQFLKIFMYHPRERMARIKVNKTNQKVIWQARQSFIHFLCCCFFSTSHIHLECHQWNPSICHQDLRWRQLSQLSQLELLGIWPLFRALKESSQSINNIQ